MAAYVGQSLERLEDDWLLTGRGAFADDLGTRPGTLHAAILRSPHAHAELRGIDLVDAVHMQGVHTVLTGEDVRRWSRPFVIGVKQPMEHWCCAQERVRYVGEPVAVVLAEDRYLAEDALEYIRVDYRPLPAVVDPIAALADQAPVLHSEVGGNVVSDRDFRYGDPEAAFAAAAHRVELNVRYPRSSCTPIEGYVAVVEYLGGDAGYDVFSNFQGPFALHPVMALALHLPPAKLRLRMPRDSGGSFGVKQGIFPYLVLLCLAARKAGRPVKWVEDRLEHLQAASSATNRATTIAAAVTGDGTITALDYDQVEDCGAYLRAPEPATLYRMHGILTGAYRVPNLHVRNRVVLTNKTPAGLNRGFGGPQVYYALERLVHEIARTLRLDPLDVYRRNFIPATSMPYRAPAGALVDSGDYHVALERAAVEGKLADLRARRDAARREGRLYGIGFAAVVEPSISNMGYISTVLAPEDRQRAGPKNGGITAATVNVDALGGVSVTADSTPQGQGHITVLAQVVADALGLAPRDIAVNLEYDTQKDAGSIAAGNYSSRFAGAVAGTAHLAAMRIRDRLAAIAAPELGCGPGEVEFAEGRLFSGSNPQKRLAFNRVAGGAHWSPATLPAGASPAMRETVFWTPEVLTAPDPQDHVNTSAAYSFVFDICAVEVDRDTGQVRIDRYVSLHDAGRLLNPALADGQVRGGFAQGVGAALYEAMRYGDDGSFLSGTFADYLVPTACEVPEPQIIHMETLSPFTPLGAKGLGEGNNMSTPVCIANAVADALAEIADVRQLDLPLTPSSVLALISPPESPAPASEIATPASTIAASLREPSPAGGPSAAGGARASLNSDPAPGGPGLAASGSVDIAAPPDVVFRVLVDPDALARVIPGCRALERVGDHRYRADVTLGIGVVRARFDASIQLSELDAPRSLVLAGSGTGALGAAEGRGTVTLAAIAGGTRLDYAYRSHVTGKLAAVGGRMLDGAAKVVLRELFRSLGKVAVERGGVVQPASDSSKTTVAASAADRDRVGSAAATRQSPGERRGWWERLRRWLAGMR
ncbi:MAG: molybdopterin cofactor-binding domain-containing protein [Caldimonas sp.]